MAQTLKIRIDGDASGFKSATDEAEGIMGRLGSTIGGLAATAAKVGLAIGAVGVAFAAKIGVDSLGAAVDFNETVSKVGVLFGDAAGQIEAFADTAATKLGQSKQQAMDAAATFATFGKAAGLTGADLSKFSTGFVGLASDLASFNNTSPEQAIDAIGAALRGESEPLRAYGVLLDDASMRQKALELGIISTTKEALTPQQKVLAAQALIYEQTSAAQGDFERTSDGLANKQRILSAQFENVKIKIGQQLLPVAMKLATFVSETLLPAFEKFGPILAGKVAPVLMEIIGAFQALFAAFKSPAEGITSSGLPGFFERLGIAARATFDWLKVNVPPVIEAIREGFTTKVVPALTQVGAVMQEHVLPALAKLGQFIVSTVLPAVAQFYGWVYGTLYPALVQVAAWVITTLVPAIAAIATWINDNVVPAVQAFAQWITGSLVPALAIFWDWLTAKLQPVIADLVDWFNAKVVPALASIWEAINGSLVPALASFWEFISSKVIPVIQDVAGVVLPKLWDALQTLANFAMDVAIPAIVAIAKFMVETGLAIIETGVKIATFVVGAVQKFGELAVGVGEKIGEVIGFVTGLPGRVTTAIGDLGTTLYSAGKALIDGLLNGIKDAVTDTLNFVSGIADKIADVKGPLPYDRRVLVPAGRALMEGLASGIEQGMGQVESMVGGIAPQMAVQLSPAAMSGRSSGGVVIEVHGNVYGPGGARWLAEELRAYEGSLR